MVELGEDQASFASSHTVEVRRRHGMLKVPSVWVHPDPAFTAIQSLESVPALSPALVTGSITTYSQSKPEIQPEMHAYYSQFQLFLPHQPILLHSLSPPPVTDRRRDRCKKGKT